MGDGRVQPRVCSGRWREFCDVACSGSQDLKQNRDLWESQLWARGTSLDPSKLFSRLWYETAVYIDKDAEKMDLHYVYGSTQYLIKVK